MLKGRHGDADMKRKRRGGEGREGEVRGVGVGL